ncbi:MAG: carbohydrate kinase, partial [Proteobacteria bacterium]|nr:carbohydrate kinase [Pseudomonadota bacterium]
YRFPAPCAWDALEADAAALAAATGATVVYGTLAQRTPAAAAAIAAVLDVARWRVLDVNLRPPHAGREVVLAALARADFVKVNDEELGVLAGWLGIAPDAGALQARLAATGGAGSLCVTAGAHGARLWHGGRFVEQPAVPTVVADTVGAGDAFLAMLLAQLLAGAAAEIAMARAARLAAFVASQPGATPDYAAARFRD